MPKSHPFRFKKKRVKDQNNNNNSNSITNSDHTKHDTYEVSCAAGTPAYHRQASSFIDSIEQLLGDLLDNKTTDRTEKALKRLYAITSEEMGSEEWFIHAQEFNFVPTLLNFIERAEKGSYLQSLALLVLNNLCIPSELKRFIAIECQALRIVERLLCENPSCHISAIIIVNLAFANSDLRSEILASSEIIHALCFALRVSSLTQTEYEHRLQLVETDPLNPQSPAKLLGDLLAEDGRQYNAPGPHLTNQLFPHTTRWCLVALKSLTRPCRDTTAAETIMRSGIAPHILQFLTMSNQIATIIDTVNSVHSIHGESANSSEGEETPVPVDPLDHETNLPTEWESNGSQDAALYIVMNLAAVPVSRQFLRETRAVDILAALAGCNIKGQDVTEEQMEFAIFQRLKARMALAFLLGSEGHFGQPPRSKSSNVKLVSDSMDDLIMTLNESETFLLLELLLNTLQWRSKSGIGGYSASTFSVKPVLFAIRCLITNHLNQAQLSSVGGMKLNILLLKSIALHSLKRVEYIDAEAAEHAVFTLYTLSRCGFRVPFLPEAFGGREGTKSIFLKILTAYKQSATVTPAGEHAAEQLRLRYRYLIFKGEVLKDIALSPRWNPLLEDLSLGTELTSLASKVIVSKMRYGVKPRPDIFNRPILRMNAPSKSTSVSPLWMKNVECYENALDAAQEFSFGSICVRHLDEIDDIQIANNIANCANGDKTESYNFMWSWQDTAGKIQRNFERALSSDSFLTRNADSVSVLSNQLTCFCANDTTAE